MVKKAVKPYGGSQSVKGVLDNMKAVEVKLMTSICEIKAKSDLKELGLLHEVDNLMWRLEQKYRGLVNSKMVHASTNFEGAEPYVVVAWKLVPR